jgi:hypothetical protein
MTNLTTPPRAIFRQIQANLKDRYASGFPVLKELIQNAEDAGARHIRFVAHKGWRDAANPLLRVPGLLVINDGRFEAKDERGILSFADSAKGDEAEAIGRFGFGQKAVFHLCDAFVAHAFGHSAIFSAVVNPCLGVIDNTQAASWDTVGQKDLALLAAEASDFRMGFLLWLPLRCEAIMPAPTLSFTSYRPYLDDLVAEFIQHAAELRLILSGLRHLDRISVQMHDETRLVLSRSSDSGRMRGPADNPHFESQSFQGKIDSVAGNSSVYVGREACGISARLEELKESDAWPQVPVFTEQGEEIRPEKAVAHGAVIITDRADDPLEAIDFDWGVFLPVARATRLEPSAPGLLILLHGYFFVDSGRRYIEGFDNDNVGDSSIYRDWNETLRNEIVLPLLPSALHDAFQAQMLSTDQLADILALLRKDRFGRVHARAIARRDCLIRAVEPSAGDVLARWTLRPGDVSLRPLPHPDERGRINAAGIFADLCGWADGHGLTLFAGAEAALIRDKAEWQSEELSDLLKTLSAAVFRQGGRAEVLAAFLKVAVGEDEARREAAAEPLLASLRRSLIGKEALANEEQLRAVLAHLPAKAAVALPRSAGAPRDVLRALAEVQDAPPCLRSEWLADDVTRLALSTIEAVPLIAALQPLLRDHRNADAAGAAALALVKLLGHRLLEASKDPQIAALSILRAGDGSGQPQLVGLADLIHASRERRLFKDNPNVQRMLKALAEAVPESGALVLGGEAARLVEEIGPPFSFVEPKRENFARLILGAEDFGPPEALARAIDQIYTNAPDTRRALRILVAGDTHAGDDAAQLFALPQAGGRLDNLALHLIEGSVSDFLIPNIIAETLTPPRQRHLGIMTMDGPGLGQLLTANAAELAEITLDDDTIVALLESEIPDEDLCQLSIFPTSDGRSLCSSEVWRPSADWPIPSGLAKFVPIVKPLSGRKAVERLNRLVGSWSPEAQLDVALAQTQPHYFWREILSALGQLKSKPPMGLSEVKWLADRQGRAWSPADLLDLPEEVLVAARGLSDAGAELPFLPLSDLARDLRDDPAFEALRSSGVLPDKSDSIDALLLMVEDMAPLARMGEATDEGADALAALARQGADLGLPGWPLLAALLRQPDAEPIKLIRPFGAVSKDHFRDAVAHMNALADLAERGDAAAHVVYDLAFRAVCAWSTETMHDLFHETRVPTEAGTWRFGREVAGLAAGLAQSHMLLERLGKQMPKGKSRETEADHDGRTAPISTHPPSEVARIEANAAESLRILLAYAKSEVPADLLILLVGLVRRTDAFRDMARKELGVQEADIERIWKRFDLELEGHFKPFTQGENLSTRRNQRFLTFTPVLQQRTVTVETLSGTTQALPVGDLWPLVVVGDSHRRWKWQYVGRDLYGFTDILTATPAATVTTGHLKTLCNTLAEELIGGRQDQAKCFEALSNLAESCDRIDQTTVETAQADLEDQLPHILDEIKPTQGTALWAARDQYDSEKRALATLDERHSQLPKLKRKLWKSIQAPEARVQLLAAVRGRIEDYGYSPDRVLFELFQNADDASLQHPPPGQACFRLEVVEGRMRAVHWGRLINHPGPDAQQGAREGWLRDLFNMLLMNLSEKREDVTGRFGLGFKSVHLIAAEVGIASGFVACRVKGGMLPEVWEGGRQVSLDHSADGRRGTVIELLPDDDRADQAHAAVQAFCKAARWLPAMSRMVRRIELSGSEPRLWGAEHLPLAKGIGLVSLSGATPGRALTLDLGEETTLFLLLSSDGPVPAEEGLPRLWLLAPLAETLKSGWLMNGRTFRVDPGRGSLKRGEGEPQDTFARLGVTLGEKLIALADLAHDDWSNFAAQLGLADESPETGPTTFWTRLSELFALDLDDALACHLHSSDHGYGRLISERAVLPTGLPRPFASLTCAGDAQYSVEGLMSEPALLADLRDWTVLDALETTTVGRQTSQWLQRLGYSSPHPISLASAIRQEIGNEKRVAPKLADRLGRVLTEERLERLDRTEEQNLLAVLAAAQYRMCDDTWREARLPPREATDSDEEEGRILAFAPDVAVADSDYGGKALAIYRLAMRQSGFQRTSTTFFRWAEEMADPAGQGALLRYVLEGRQGTELGMVLARKRPTWLPEQSDDLRESPLVSEIPEPHLPQLLGLLYPEEQRRRWGIGFGSDYTGGNEPESGPIVEPSDFLEALHEWWLVNSQERRAAADNEAYPDGFRPSSLIDKAGDEDREGWFTFLALAIFRTIGRTSDRQHRSFIAKAQQSGWWSDIATAKLPDDPGPWISRLEEFARADAWRIDFPQWRRALVDLYLLARWLPEYVEALQALPSKIEENGQLSLSDAFRLSSSPLWQRLGLEGAPLSQSLGIGANWLIRESVRHGLWQGEEAQIIHPYAWASSRSVRERIFEPLGLQLGDQANPDLSREIYDFIEAHIGRNVSFCGDLDLPFQIASKNEIVLQNLFDGFDLTDEDAFDDDDKEIYS